MNFDHFNNIGLAAIAISETLAKATNGMTLSKVPLIFPTVMHRQTLSYLSRKNINISGFTSLFIEHPEFFTNFWRRYEVSLATSFNAILLLNEIGVTHLEGRTLSFIRPITAIDSMGARAQKISRAASNVERMLESSPEELYLNLRIKL
ncbi:DUF6521 family protein [Acidovorax sp. DW039]|uniref:three component ABC system middle component n=1 Tax=Acidovorax sp. DW039 TaxID=3095606 RepID=UPI00308D77A7|nr:DUF6521 family protein [Acidovorax sp. DW039]